MGREGGKGGRKEGEREEEAEKGERSLGKRKIIISDITFHT